MASLVYFSGRKSSYVCILTAGNDLEVPVHALRFLFSMDLVIAGLDLCIPHICPKKSITESTSDVSKFPCIFPSPP